MTHFNTGILTRIPGAVIVKIPVLKCVALLGYQWLASTCHFVVEFSWMSYTVTHAVTIWDIFRTKLTRGAELSSYCNAFELMIAILVNWHTHDGISSWIVIVLFLSEYLFWNLLITMIEIIILKWSFVGHIFWVLWLPLWKIVIIGTIIFNVLDLCHNIPNLINNRS